MGLRRWNWSWSGAGHQITKDLLDIKILRQMTLLRSLSFEGQRTKDFKILRHQDIKTGSYFEVQIKKLIIRGFETAAHLSHQIRNWTMDTSSLF